MTITGEQPESGTTAASAWRRMRLWGLAHAVDDLYQGLVPATVPYFVLERHYGYVAASGLTLAATLGNSVPQPVFGLAVDRLRAGWMAGAGVGVAGLGLSLAGVVPGYAGAWCMILLSGLGVAMFHPAAGKAAREQAGDSAAAMSLFAAGGSAGFFLAPALATPALIALGVRATAVFLPPAALMSFVLLRRHRREAVRASAARRGGPDQWRPFAALTCIEVLRSAAFFGLNTFIELYWIRHLHATRGLAGAALTCFLAGGVGGTLLGGRIADRIGAVRTVQAGAAVTLPALGALLLAPGGIAPLAGAFATGVALNIPFAVLVKLGQDYLPARPGTAAGVTLGLGVSAGGLLAPLLGLVADAHGPRGALIVLLAVPPAAMAFGLLLRDPGRAGLQACQRGLVRLPPEVLPEDLGENGLVRRGGREQRHGGTELHRIHGAEDLLGAPALGAGDDPGAFGQPGTEHRVPEVGPGLVQRGDRELPRCRAAAKALDLREDEPHPVAHLPARAQFGDRAPVRAAGVLRGREPLKPVRIVHVNADLLRPVRNFRGRTALPPLAARPAAPCAGPAMARLDLGAKLVLLAPVRAAERIGPGAAARPGELVFLAPVRAAEGAGPWGTARPGELVFPAAAGIGTAEGVRWPVPGFRVLGSGHGGLLCTGVLLRMLPPPASAHAARERRTPGRLLRSQLRGDAEGHLALLVHAGVELLVVEYRSRRGLKEDADARFLKHLISRDWPLGQR
jgi:FSR family fosmidomycin resistance protein-like MFS transporter